MKRAHLLHNPGAGEKDFSKTELLKLIQKEGFDCSYASLKKKGWEQFPEDADFIIIAGGDGTIRLTAKALLKRTLLDRKYPFALLPHGTANNIAGTLNVSGKVSDIIHAWHKSVPGKFDVGRVTGLKETEFFLEAFGFGIFPVLMQEMERIEDHEGSREDKINIARAVLYDIVLGYEACTCKIVADGVDHTGKYIMVEVMNIKSIGPNLELSETSDPGDGEFEIVLIPEDHQKKFEEFLLNRIQGKEDTYSFTTLKAKNIQVFWQGKDLHVDDEIVKIDQSAEINISVQPGLMEFLLTEEK
jgi:diacylglycerol kinase (ATP)